MKATLYAHPRCDTCKKARRWLDDHRIAYDVIDLTASPPNLAALRSIRGAAGVPARKLFNTSGQAYRAGGVAERLSTMDEEAMLALLASDGMLVKRPILVRDGLALVGFSADAYARALA